MIATSIVTRAEVAAALAKAARVGIVTEDRARKAQRSFAGDWPDLVRVPVTGGTHGTGGRPLRGTTRYAAMTPCSWHPQ